MRSRVLFSFYDGVGEIVEAFALDGSGQVESGVIHKKLGTISLLAPYRQTQAIFAIVVRNWRIDFQIPAQILDYGQMTAACCNVNRLRTACFTCHVWLEFVLLYEKFDDIESAGSTGQMETSDSIFGLALQIPALFQKCLKNI